MRLKRLTVTILLTNDVGILKGVPFEMTMAKVIRNYVETKSRTVTAEEIKNHINTDYAGQWKSSTIQSHLYACVVNNPKAYIHHPNVEKFLYKDSEGNFELYSEAMHGPNEWAPVVGDDEESDMAELVETTISLERDIEDHLVYNLNSIETGLRLLGRQVTNDAGRIDILAEDIKGYPVIIEIKVGEAKDSAIGQVARYLGWYAKAEEKTARAILVAGSFPESIRYAAEAIPGLTLMSYRINFSFEMVTI